MRRLVLHKKNLANDCCLLEWYCSYVHLPTVLVPTEVRMSAFFKLRVVRTLSDSRDYFAMGQLYLDA